MPPAVPIQVGCCIPWAAEAFACAEHKAGKHPIHHGDNKGKHAYTRINCAFFNPPKAPYYSDTSLCFIFSLFIVLTLNKYAFNWSYLFQWFQSDCLLSRIITRVFIKTSVSPFRCTYLMSPVFISSWEWSGNKDTTQTCTSYWRPKRRWTFTSEAFWCS